MKRSHILILAVLSSALIVAGCAPAVKVTKKQPQIDKQPVGTDGKPIPEVPLAANSPLKKLQGVWFFDCTKNYRGTGFNVAAMLEFKNNFMELTKGFYADSDTNCEKSPVNLGQTSYGISDEREISPEIIEALITGRETNDGKTSEQRVVFDLSVSGFVTFQGDAFWKW